MCIVCALHCTRIDVMGDKLLFPIMSPILSLFVLTFVFSLSVYTVINTLYYLLNLSVISHCCSLSLCECSVSMQT